MNFFNLDNPNNWMYVGIIVCVFILIATFGIYCNINLFKNNKKRFAKEALRGNNKITVCFLPRQKDKANEFKQWVQTTYPQYRLMSGDNSYAIIATSVIPSKRIILEYQK